ncbi:hypothetical protein SLEP1_g33220 [Rubroshorea leprosula]|uniref:Uncharacterized protein n=1 Tax=Rubroshorea leprosula TaxID=152421 RepID=A0AAV5KFY5_9ROSI|nr:hypothetical protein SLEP1_g33220 [Rubroshorea leprosula]
MEFILIRPVCTAIDDKKGVRHRQQAEREFGTGQQAERESGTVQQVERESGTGNKQRGSPSQAVSKGVRHSAASREGV